VIARLDQLGYMLGASDQITHGQLRWLPMTLHCRRIVGYSVDSTITRKPTIDALEMAIA
jgi:hypothetical protein